MANTLKGRILEIRPTQTIISKKSGNQFSKRELILDCTRCDSITGERGFENTPVITFAQDKCALLDAFGPGHVVMVSIDITGRTYIKDGIRNYINDVRGYDIKLYSPQQYAPQQPQNQTPQPPVAGGYATPAGNAPQMPQQSNGNPYNYGQTTYSTPSDAPF